MPLLIDDKRIDELRAQFPILTHTSWKELSEIIPHPNMDKHYQQMGNIVCATSTDSDFYALRCNERKGMINYSVPYRDPDGKINRIFIFEKMKDTYYEHSVSSKNFIPIVSRDGTFSGEWVSHDVIKPIFVKIGKKEDILRQTRAKVFTISNLEQFQEKLNDDAFVKRVGDVDTSLKMIKMLVRLGILHECNSSEETVNRYMKCTEDRKNMVQEDTSKSPLSVSQQVVILLKQPQY